MNDIIKDLLENGLLWTALLAWFVAQTIKVIIGIFKEKRFNFKWFVGTGGMPSSHASAVCSLAASIGFVLGFDSIIFAVTCIFTLITLFDAQGVRRASGTQAEILNKIIEDIYFKKKIGETRLKELLGHTPFEVLIGGLLGVVIAAIRYR